jgi:GcrA cell cycle regulator
MTVSPERLAAAQSHNGWSPVRVEVMKALWNEGFSCSQIAARLKHVSRNAVIGKANRLGLPSRHPLAVGHRVAAGLALKGGRQLKAPPVARVYNPLGRKSGTPAARAPEVKADPHLTRNLSAKLAAAAKRPEGEPLPPERPHDAPVVALEALTARSCRWPVGDPHDPGFGFCGQHNRGDGPYCAHHHRIAYQPLPAKAPKTGNELMRSLRRYA